MAAETPVPAPLAVLRTDAERRGYVVRAYASVPHSLRISHPLGRGGWWVGTWEQWLDVLANRKWSGDPVDEQAEHGPDIAPDAGRG